MLALLEHNNQWSGADGMVSATDVGAVRWWTRWAGAAWWIQRLSFVLLCCAALQVEQGWAAAHSAYQVVWSAHVRASTARP